MLIITGNHILDQYLCSCVTSWNTVILKTPRYFCEWHLQDTVYQKRLDHRSVRTPCLVGRFN